MNVKENSGVIYIGYMSQSPTRQKSLHRRLCIVYSTFRHNSYFFFLFHVYKFIRSFSSALDTWTRTLRKFLLAKDTVRF